MTEEEIQQRRKAARKRAAFVWTGAGMFSAGFIASPAVLPLADLSLMLVTVGVTAPAGIGFALLQYLDYVATREDVRVKREVQPEREPQGASR